MSAAHVTTTALLENLLDPSNERAWIELDARFRPVLFAFTRRMGLSEADAEDVTQESLIRFVKAFRNGQYDKTRGRLSSWLIGIAQNCVFDLRQSSKRRIDWRGESVMGNISETDSMEAIWDQECRRVLLEKAMGELRSTSKMEEKTVAAFEMLVKGNHTAPQVAELSGMNIDSVYAAKNRCLSLMRKILERLHAEYEMT